MPFIIRFILQRLLILLYSFLAFLGIAPETSIPTEAEASAAIEERRERISEFFKEEETKETIRDIVDNTNKIKDDIIKEINNIDLNIEKDPVEIEQKSSDTISQIIQDTLGEIGSVENSLTTRNDMDDVVVNIVCTKEEGNLISVSTGSGVIIDPKGIIITNAHVGQFVLLEDNYNYSKCSVYKENIPAFGYLVDVLYISPDWIKQNYKIIDSENPRGTGELDYAFLYITDSTNPTIKKPLKFPYSEVSFNENNYNIGNRVKVAGYPGAPTKISEIFSSGILKKDTVSIVDVFTFNKYSIDVVSTSNTSVGAKGASGGGVFNNGNNLIAIISTTNGEQNNAQINAITTTYINDSLKNITGKGISEFSTDPEAGVESFDKNYGSSLARLLINELN